MYYSHRSQWANEKKDLSFIEYITQKICSANKSLNEETRMLLLYDGWPMALQTLYHLACHLQSWSKCTFHFEEPSFWELFIDWAPFSTFLCSLVVFWYISPTYTCFWRKKPSKTSADWLGKDLPSKVYLSTRLNYCWVINSPYWYSIDFCFSFGLMYTHFLTSLWLEWLQLFSYN